MCGIAGFIINEKQPKKIIKKMTDRIAHRGPDAEGFYVDKNIALGHRRLSIIDLDTGDQPMFNHDKSLVIIFNGEIYNFQELKKELLKMGYKFNTKSDTEVLLNGYSEWKEDLPKKLRGMFAFVIWDIKNKVLFGARDHFGIKPFYYYNMGETFLFGSEIKSFLDHPCFKKVLNKDLLAPYLCFGYTPGEETFFKGVNRLNPGHCFTYKDGDLKINRYFYLTFNEQNGNPKETINNIANIMKDSVKHHMISDVEVGSFLSSGIDSSYIVCLSSPDKTYTVGSSNPKYNEINYAEDLAEKLNIKNISKKLTKEEYMNIVPKIMYYMDEPLPDPSAIALYFVSELASKDVKVILSGEGADEFFGGYYHENLLFYNRIPFFIRRTLAKIGRLFPEMRGINFLVRRGQVLEKEYIGINRIFSDRLAKKVLNTRSIIENSFFTKQTYNEQKDNSKLIKKQAIDINLWLVKDILHKADRMTMANSIEGRVPFVDIEVFNVARHLPDKGKITKENSKVYLREASKSVIPNESYKKKKLGFPVPLREWIREEDFYEKIKSSFELPIAKELFNYKTLMKLLNSHKNHKKDTYKKIWAIYCFIIWHQEFFSTK